MFSLPFGLLRRPASVRSSAAIPPRSLQRRPIFEELERRELLSASTDLLPVLLAPRGPEVELIAHKEAHHAKPPVKVVFAVHGTHLQGTEGTAVSGTVATFTGLPGSYKAKIAWGDGKTSVGKIQPQRKHPHSFIVVGSHAYASEGAFRAKVTVTPLKHKSLSATTPVRVADSRFTATGLSITASAGTAFNGAVASFTPSRGDRAADYTATIVWGDGQTSTGTLQVDPSISGALDVVGSNTYAAGGSFTIGITIKDKGGKSATGQASALVTSQAPVITQAPSVTGVNVSANSGAVFSGPVASFTPAAGATSADYQANIVWGDGQSSPGTIAPDPTIPGNLEVTGSNTYASGGGFTVGVTVQDDQGHSTMTQAFAQVAFPNSLTANSVGVTGVAGQGVTTTVANFTPSDPTATGYSANIVWGDGQSSAGTIQPDPTSAGSFDIVGSNTYAAAGSFTIQTTIAGPAASGETVTGEASILSAGTLTASGLSAMASANTPFSGTVATFLPTGGTATGYSASIAWGDGQTSPGTIQVDPNQPGTFDIAGSNTYATARSFTATITLQGPGGTSATATTKVGVSAAGVLTADGVDIAASAGTAFSGAVALATLLGGTATGVSATITWGDGQTSAGTFARDPNIAGAFDVTGTNTYANGGSFTVHVALEGPGNLSATAQAQATVNTPNTINAHALTVVAAAGQSFTGAVATFTIPGQTPAPAAALPTGFRAAALFSAAAADPAPGYTATIAWGDGQSSSGTIQVDPNAPALLDVVGTNVYAKTGNFSVSVTINGPAGSVTVGKQSAVAIPVTLSEPNINPIATTPFTGVVSTFTAPGAQAANYSAFIQWGDGTSSEGWVTADSVTPDTFEVNGTHTYDKSGATTINVTVTGRDHGGAVAQGVVGVINPGFSVAGQDITVGLNQQFSGQVGTCTIANGSTTGFSAVVHWGDGQSSPGTIAPDPSGATNLFDITGTHTYTSGTGVLPLQVEVDGAVVTLTSTHQVTVERRLAVSAGNVFNEPIGMPFTEQFATFTAPGQESAYSATIDWLGDGHPSPAVLTPDPVIGGQFDVSGTHSFATAGSFEPKIVITGSDGSIGRGTGLVITLPANDLTIHVINQTIAVNTAIGDRIATVTIPSSDHNTYVFTVEYGNGQVIQPISIGADPAGNNLFDLDTLNPIITQVGTFPVRVIATEPIPSTDVAVGTGTLTVTGAGSTTFTGVNVSPSTNLAFTGTVAILHVPGAGTTLPNVFNQSVSIQWGDGNTSSGTFKPDARPDFFDLVGSNTYAQTGTFTISVAIPAPLLGDLFEIMSQAHVAELNADLSGVATALGTALQTVQHDLIFQALEAPLPLVGTSLDNDQAITFINQFESTLVNSLSSKSVGTVQQTIFNGLGPNGLAILGDTNKDGSIDASDVVVTNNSGAISFEVKLVSQTTLTNIPFADGLDGLGLNVAATGSAQVVLQFSWDLSFGLTSMATPIIQAGALDMTITGTVPGLQVNGSFGNFASLSGMDDGNTPSNLEVQFQIPVAIDPTGTVVSFTPLLTLSADLHLDVTATLGSVSLTGNLNAIWISSNLLVSPGGFNAPVISLDNVQLDIGSFVVNLLKPIVTDIQIATKNQTLGNIISLLQTPIPIISSLAHTNITFASILDGVAGIHVEDFINGINDINKINPANFDQASGNILLGNFSFSLSPTTNQMTASSKDATPPDVFGAISAVTSAVDALKKVGFAFPILDQPVQVIGMLLNQPATFFTYTTPALNADVHYTNVLHPIPLIPLVAVTIDGDLNFHAQATFGFDSTGLMDGNFADGFFVQGALANNAIAQLASGLTISVGLDAGDFQFGPFSLSSILSKIGINFSQLKSNFLTLDVFGNLTGTINVNLAQAGNSGRVDFSHIVWSNPFNFTPSLQFSFGYDASIDLPDPLGFIPSLPKEIIIGPGHVVVGTFQLWPKIG
jgi:hypothetical protein